MELNPVIPFQSIADEELSPANNSTHSSTKADKELNQVVLSQFIADQEFNSAKKSPLRSENFDDPDEKDFFQHFIQ